MKPSVLLNDFRDLALTLVYPRGCELCSTRSVEKFANGVVCDFCWVKTHIFDASETLCEKCGRLLVACAGESGAKAFCHRCDNDFYDVARAVGSYEDALRVTVLELKEKPFVPLKLKNLIVQTFHRFPLSQSTAIIPVPLHPKRLRERGFNQAAVLAQSLSQKVALPVFENCLVREVYTKQHRGAMDEKMRRESVEKAFLAQQPRLLENQKILLVDDVFTSGATVSACAKVLKEKGASAVFVLTVARAF